MQINDTTVSKMLDVSTCHITCNDADILSHITDHSFYGLVVYDLSGYGWFVCIPEDEDVYEEIVEEGFSKHFINILRIAQRNNILYIRFDSDGHIHKGAPTFDW